MVWLIKTNPFILEFINTCKKKIFINRLHKTIIYFPPIRYRRSSSARSISSFKKKFSFRYFYFLIGYSFYLLYFFYITIIIFLFHDLIKVRVMSRIKAFSTSITGLIIIIAYNKNNRRGDSLALFYDLFGT
jgi:hypothetical protein